MSQRIIGRAVFRNADLSAVTENLLVLYDGVANPHPPIPEELSMAGALDVYFGYARQRIRPNIPACLSVPARFDHLFRLALELNVELEISCTPIGPPNRFDVLIDLREFVEKSAFDFGICAFEHFADSPSEFVMFGDDGTPWRYTAGDGPLRKSMGRIVFDDPSE